MVESSFAQRQLAERLRSLRLQHPAGPVTQAQLAEVLGVSVPLISSWEQGNAVPPEERLKSYALAFAGTTSIGAAESDRLTTAEEAHRRRLIDELVELRDLATRPIGESGPHTGALGGRFWYFPDGAPIRIITSPLWPSVENRIPYANRWHPNHIASLHDADRDATIELFGHIRAENPTADVRFLTAELASDDDLTGHVVILGQADQPAWGQGHGPDTDTLVIRYLTRRLELPVGTRLPDGGDPEFDSEFVVTTDHEGVPHYFAESQRPEQVETYPPRFLQDTGPSGPVRRTRNGYPQLEYDVALLARKPNQLNLGTSVTFCSGVFSRGTYGAVRALTDANLRSRNELFLSTHFGNFDDFWYLFYVPVFQRPNGLNTITPDLARPFHRLRSSR